MEVGLSAGLRVRVVIDESSDNDLARAGRADRIWHIANRLSLIAIGHKLREAAIGHQPSAIRNPQSAISHPPWDLVLGIWNLSTPRPQLVPLPPPALAGPQQQRTDDLGTFPPFHYRARGARGVEIECLDYRLESLCHRGAQSIGSVWMGWRDHGAHRTDRAGAQAAFCRARHLCRLRGICFFRTLFLRP